MYPLFEQKLLNLNNIDIKIRTNNSLENFNKLFNSNFKHKGPQEPYLFLDTIMEEVIYHQNEIDDFNSKSSQDISKIEFYGKSKKEFIKNNSEELT